MMESPNTSSAANICQLCNERIQLYTCPRCNIGYCGVECYKSDVHTDCSESFYKQCVEDDLKAQENDPIARQKMMEILKRVHEADLDINLEDSEDESSDEGDFTLDSDDEEELTDLTSRLENVNFEDPNELWSALSDAERQEFEALLKNGEAEKLLPKWTPWWTHRVEKKLIQSIEEDSKDAHSDLIHPTLIDVPLFNELQKASPCVQFNMTNVIYAYAYVALYYYGDYLSCAVDATNVFLIVCENMRNNKVFEDVNSAIESVIKNINNNDWLPQDEQIITALKEAGTSILHGPGAEMKSLYVSAALSDLHRLLTAAKKEISTDKSANSNQEFTKRFPQNYNNDLNLSKKICAKRSLQHMYMVVACVRVPTTKVAHIARTGITGCMVQHSSHSFYRDYGSSDEGSETENEKNRENVESEVKCNVDANVDFISKPFSVEKLTTPINLQVCSAPEVVPTGTELCVKHVDPTTKEVSHNPKYEELFGPEVGPENPFKTQQQRAVKNMLSGYVESAHISEFQFENQRRTFASYGYALDPTIDGSADEGKIIIGAKEAAEELGGKTVFESTILRPSDKRKRHRNNNPADIEGFLGPWGGYVDEKRVVKPSEEEAAELEEILAKRNKRGKQTEEKPLEEKTVLHIKDSVDYQGRSFLHAPQDVGVNLRSDSPPDRCFLPKAQIHTWEGHTKGISQIRWFPHTAHLLLSCSMDCRVKLWEVYKERRCVRTYYGHRQAVRDISFDNDGKRFLSAAYDRYVKLWDTETGACISRFTSRKIPYCAKFNPDPDKQHLFVAGTSDKKIICWDIRSGEITQEYDRHLGAVNTITFVDENRRFVTTSDDKSLRVWEWDIPVDMKYIADPSMHSMPAVTPSRNQKWLACQSMDNKIVIFSALNRFKMNRKKTFTGHMVAGYACGLDFSPDMSYLVSGDADGKCYIWDWKTTKLYKKWKAHDGVCIDVLWHPHEPSRLATAGWDGKIKYWD